MGLDNLLHLNPTFKIMLEGQNIIIPNDRLISLQVCDKAGMESDSVTIVLDQRGWKIERPSKGKKLDIFLGYRESGLHNMGKFAVDETSITFAPQKLTITGKAAAMQGGLKNQRKQSYHEKTLGDIVEEIAGRNNLKPAISNELKNKQIAHIDQFNESDMHFLTRLSKRYGAIFTVKEDNLLFIYRGEGKTTSGLNLPTINLSINDIESGTHKSGDRAKYDEVVAEYHDLKTGKREQCKAESSSGMEGKKAVHNIKTCFATKEEAQDAADAYMRTSLVEDGTLSISMVGKAEIKAETILNLVGGWPPELEGSKWVIDQATHNLSSNYRTNFTAKTPYAYAKKQRKKANKK